MKIMTERHNDTKSRIIYYRDEEHFRHGSELIDITFGNVCGENSFEINNEFLSVINTRPSIKNPVASFVLSLVPGEVQSKYQWTQIIEEFLKRMKVNPTEHLWCGVRHSNTPCDHIHLEVCRVSFSGRVWNPSYEVIKCALVATALEDIFELTPTIPMAEINEDGKLVFPHKPQKRQPSLSMRTAAGLNKTNFEIIQDAIDSALRGGREVLRKNFEKYLAERGITVRANEREGEFVGYRFSYKKDSYKGSSLGMGYGLSGLQSRGLIVNEELNLSRIKRNIEPIAIKKGKQEGEVNLKESTREGGKVREHEKVSREIVNKQQEAYNYRESKLIQGDLKEEMKRESSTADKRYVTMALTMHKKFSENIFGLDKKVNWKKLDAEIALRLLQKGFDKKQVVNALKRFSPEAVAKDQAIPEQYANDLVHEVMSKMAQPDKKSNGLSRDYLM